MKVLEKAKFLKTELDKFRPLSAELEARIMQKFRLDWNYHSNHLEGNSLSYGETKALILFNITASGKPLRDHFEMSGHNEAILEVLDFIKEHKPLTEKFIREIHILLLKEPYKKAAKTPDGMPTHRLIEIGKYKSVPNHVELPNGEMFYFASPDETPAKMGDLVNWYKEEKEKANVDFILLAALFHYKFITIHPFDDGNGRTARIFMNFILMQAGYPPVIIKTGDKENYFNVLRMADSGQVEPFVAYIATNLVYSLELMIKGANGENIDDDDDLDKEIALLRHKIRGEQNKTGLKRTKVLLDSAFLDFIPVFMERIEKMLQKFKEFFESIEILYNTSLKGGRIVYMKYYWEKEVEREVVFFHIILENVVASKKKSSLNIQLNLSFGEYRYSFHCAEYNLLLQKKYDEPFTEEEMDGFIKPLSKIILEHIQKQLNP